MEDLGEKYIKLCAANITRNLGNHNVSVFIDAKMDGVALAVKVAENQSGKDKKVAVVVGDFSLYWSLEEKHREQQKNNPKKTNYSVFLEAKLLKGENYSNLPFGAAYDRFIMLDVSDEGRKFVAEQTRYNAEAKTVSIGFMAGRAGDEEFVAAPQSIILYDELQNEYRNDKPKKNKEPKPLELEDVKPYVCYVLTEISDIRDFAQASYEEKRKIAKSINRKVDEFRYDMELMVQRMQMLDENRVPYAYFCALEQKYYELKELCAFQAQLLNAIGISESMAHDAFMAIKKKRLDLDIENKTGMAKEDALIELGEFTSKQVVDLTKNFISVKQKEEIDRELESRLGSKVWRTLLCDESRQYLFTAEANYQMMDKRKDKAELDYSGVCLLLSKVLELELHKRLYNNFYNYLDDPRNGKHFDGDWPLGLKQKYYHKATKSLKYKKVASNEFTIGSIKLAVGIMDDNGSLVINPSDTPKFKDYARGRLYPAHCTDAQLEAYAMEIATVAENLRNDYRNLAAHKTGVAQIKAQQCREYMLLIQEKLKKILEDMIM